MQGRCYYCDKKLTERTIKRHMKNCSEMKKVIESKIKESKNVRDQFIISIKDKCNSNVYCIYVSIDASLQLHHLDRFIRDIWVECCGHISSFFIDGDLYNDNSDKKYQMNVYLKDILSANKKFEYQYDFGSTTYLVLEVVDIIKVSKDFTQIEIIARNDELKHKCQSCKNEAQYYNFNEDSWYCENCIEDDEVCEFEEIDYSNSPRDGVCGYAGSKEAETKYLPQNNEKYKINSKKPIHNADSEMNITNYYDDFNLDKLSKIMTDKIVNNIDNKIEYMDFNSLEQLLKDEFAQNYGKIANSFMDMFFKGKYSFDLQELIKAYPKKQIINLAENMGLKISSNLKKVEMIEKYVVEYEKCIKNRLNILDYKIYKILQNCLKNKGIIYVSKISKDYYIDIYEYLMNEGVLFPCIKDDEPIFVMPIAMQNILKQSDNINFIKLMKRNSEVINIFIGMIKAYGYLYFNDVKILIKRYIIDMDESELFSILEQGLLYCNNQYYGAFDKEENIIYINERIEDYEEILNEIDDKLDYAMIDKEELISMSEENYLEKSNIGKGFIRELSSMFEMDRDNICENMNILALDIQYRDSDEILKDILGGIEEEIDEEDESRIISTINKFIRNIRLWKYKGATLNEKEGNNKVSVNKRVGRNNPCPCKSGKKYKNCCGKNGNVIQLF